MIAVTSWDGQTLNSTSGYTAEFPLGEPMTRSLALAEEASRNLPPTVRHVNQQPLEFTLRVSNAGTVAYATFAQNVEQWFRPWTSSTRELVATWHDGTTAVKLDCWVVAWRVVADSGSGGYQAYDVTLRASVPFWVESTTSSSGANPATVTNNGTTRAYPSIAFTQSTHKSWRSCTVVDTSGRGLVGYPVAFASTFTGATSSTLFILVNGVSVPTRFVSTSLVWARVDVPPSGTTQVDIIYGSGLSNPLGNTLDLGGMNASSSDNATWVWNNWTISDDPVAPGCWRPEYVAFTSGQPSDWGYEISAESSSGVTFQLRNPAQGAVGDANAMVLDVQTAAGTTSALAGLSRTTANHTSGVRSFVRYRTAGSSTWTTAWSTTSSAAVTTAIDLDNAVQIAVGIEYTSTTPTDAATLALATSGTFQLTLNSSTTPTVTIGSASSMDFYDGTYTNATTGQVITFTDFLVPDGTLTINCSPDRTVRGITHAAGPVLGGISFSDPAGWFGLDPGSNTITDGLTGATETLTYRDSYA